jgi:hypothetical protein
MHTLVRVGFVAAMVTAVMVGSVGCEETENPFPPINPALRDAGVAPKPEADPHTFKGPDAGVHEHQDAGPSPGPLQHQAPDAGHDPLDPRDGPSAPGDGPTPPPESQQTEVPAELVGAWAAGSFDFERWENYREGYWAGKNATPTREAMIFYEDGSAKFYRYEFLFNFYEKMVDCEGSVAFHDDGTFTFYPVTGRKRFHNFSHSEDSYDRPLTAEELVDPELAGTRAYTYDPTASVPTVEIRVPTSAPYNWYKQE